MILKINHRLGVSKVKFFNNFNLNLKFDSIASTFSFEFYFDPKNKEHAELACVSHFHEAILEHNDEVFLTGYILSNVFNRGTKKQLVQFAGYSKPGVFEDCEIPPEMYPLQFDGLTLSQIAKKFADKFKLKMIVDPTVSGSMGKVIEKTTAGAAQNIKSFLTELTTQLDIVMTHNESGDLIFTKAKTNLKPLFHVQDGILATDISMSFNGQGIHSHITVMKQADSDGGNAGEFTILNPYCPIVYRPKVLIQSSGTDNTIQETAKHALAAELRNITLTISTDRWEVNGKIIKPNNVISVLSPENYIYKKSNFFIESIAYKGDSKSTTAVLTCVPVEAYNGNTPKNLFVDAHQNLPRF